MPTLKPMTAFPSGVATTAYTAEGGVDAKPWLLLAALLLAIADLAISYALRGLAPAFRPRTAATASIALVALGLTLAAGAGPLGAQPAASQPQMPPGATPEELVRVSFEFLLEREPREAIMRQFELPIIGRFFGDYRDEMERRLSP